jgi:hypothetical protein
MERLSSSTAKGPFGRCSLPKQSPRLPNGGAKLTKLFRFWLAEPTMSKATTSALAAWAGRAQANAMIRSWQKASDEKVRKGRSTESVFMGASWDERSVFALEIALRRHARTGPSVNMSVQDSVHSRFMLEGINQQADTHSKVFRLVTRHAHRRTLEAPPP